MKKRTRLGQHFLKARWAARAVARAAGAKEGEVVLEIGAGKGALTKELLHTGAHVIAVEKDQSLVEVLEETFAQEIANGQLRVVHEDIRNIAPAALGLTTGRYTVAANIPYYITGEIIRTFLSSITQPNTMSLLVQKEVAKRIAYDEQNRTAKSKKESILSLSVKAYGTPQYVKTVRKECFSPKPRVDSAILSVKNISRDFFSDVDEEIFFGTVKAGFASKRKLLINNIAVRFGRSQAKDALGKCNVPEKARAEDVQLKEWKCISQTLSPRF